MKESNSQKRLKSNFNSNAKKNNISSTDDIHLEDSL